MHLPVLIVGAGPVGLFQAYILSKLNIPVILLERHTAPLPVPKAHFLSSRTLEIFRQNGISISTIRTYPTKREDARWIRFVTDVSGREIGVLPFDNVEVDVLNITPEILHNIPQPDLQALIMGMIEKEGKVEIRRGWTWKSCTETDDSVTSTVENTYTAETQTIRSSLIIACDGTNSRLRKAAGIALDEQDGPQMMSLHFSANLHPVVGERKGMLYWIMDPAVQGVVIAYDLAGNQVLLHQYDPSIYSQASFTSERCREIIKTALGCDAPFDFFSAVPWRMKSQVAKEYSKGRIVLGGDAAHSFPPTGGLGLNSGIADAHNLAWKLHRLYTSQTTLAPILHSYESERRPVALRNAARAMYYGAQVFELLKTLGLTDPHVDTARKKMWEKLEDPSWDEKIKEMVWDTREQFSLGNLHLGFVYEKEWKFVNGTDFEPAFRRGARLSHAWIKPSSPGTLSPLIQPVDLSYIAQEVPADKESLWKYSTLDLVPLDTHVLFCQTSDWADVAERQGVKVLRVGKDFEWTEEEAGKRWMGNYGLDKGGAVLIRPDQHVEAVLMRAEELEGVLKGIDRGLVE